VDRTDGRGGEGGVSPDAARGSDSPTRAMTRARMLGLAGALLILAIGGVWATLGVRSASSTTTIVARSPAEWYERGRELALRSRDRPGAIAAYREALALDPEMGEAHYGLGLVLLESGDVEGAAAELESAVSLAPPEASWRKDAENALVLALLRKSNPDKLTR